DVFKSGLVSADPKIGSAPRIHLLHDDVAVVALSGFAPGVALNLPFGKIGNVHVQDNSLGKALFSNLFSDFDGEGGGGGENKVVAGDQRDCHGRHPVDRPFEGRGNGAGIVDVVAQIPPLIDAGHDEVGLSL